MGVKSSFRLPQGSILLIFYLSLTNIKYLNLSRFLDLNGWVLAYMERKQDWWTKNTSKL